LVRPGKVFIGVPAVLVPKVIEIGVSGLQHGDVVADPGVE
jgi:hypothetical protein